MGGTLDAERVQWIDNSCGHKGGAVFGGDLVNIRHSWFGGNSTNHEGGAVMASGTVLDLSHSWFEGNVADNGGAGLAVIFNGVATGHNLVFINNRDARRGAGVYTGIDGGSGITKSNLSNVTLTAHLAGPTFESQSARVRNAFDNVQRVARGQAPLWVAPELEA